MKNNPFFIEDDDVSFLADGKTKLSRYCKFCGLPVEEGQDYCSETCRELFHTDIGKMTKKDWRNLAKRNKAILTGY